MSRSNKNAFRVMTAIWIVLGDTTFASTPSFLDFGKKEVNLGSVQRTNLLQQVTVAGTVVPFRRTVLGVPYNAYVQKIHVKLGETVSPGSPIVSLVQSLTGSTEQNYPLRTPFGGKVVQILHNEGEYVEFAKEGSSLVRIDDLNRLFVHCDVPEGDVTKIKVGQQVVVKANAILNRAYRGIIREVFLAAKEKKEWSRSGDRVEFEVHIEVLDKDDQIKPGMSAIVDVITQRRDKVLALAHEYVNKDKDGYFVTLGNGQKRPIEVGLRNEEFFEVLKGVRENEQVKVVDFFAAGN